MTKNFTIKIIYQTIVLSLSFFLLAFLCFKTDGYIAISIVFIITIIQIIILIHSVTKTTRQLAVFFDSVTFNDYSLSFTFKGHGKSFEKLGHSLDVLNQQFKGIRDAKEAQFNFNQNILHNVGVGIIAFDTNGNIEFSNKLFHNMMRVPYCNSLDKITIFNEELFKHLTDIEEKKKRIYKIDFNGVVQHFLLSSSNFIVNNKNTKLVVVQNIQPTIDQTEMDAWQKLIRVLTHEIMNSITPISSLADTAYTMLPKSNEATTIDSETLKDLQEALQTINRRSNGLIGFVQEYRSLTAIPQPDLAVVQVGELFKRVSTLFRAEIQNTNIHFETVLFDNNLEIIADSALIEQVILNLLKNAKQSLEQSQNPQITLSVRENEFQKVEMSIIDNGCGILPEVIDKIFIPFFTTKSNGSGIGLSLSKQIMMMHGGAILVQSNIEKGSTFVLRF